VGNTRVGGGCPVADAAWMLSCLAEAQDTEWSSHAWSVAAALSVSTPPPPFQFQFNFESSTYIALCRCEEEDVEMTDDVRDMHSHSQHTYRG
jgi:hypothetical protein